MEDAGAPLSGFAAAQCGAFAGETGADKRAAASRRASPREPAFPTGAASFGCRRRVVHEQQKSAWRRRSASTPLTAPAPKSTAGGMPLPPAAPSVCSPSSTSREHACCDTRGSHGSEPSGAGSCAVEERTGGVLGSEGDGAGVDGDAAGGGADGRGGAHVTRRCDQIPSSRNSQPVYVPPMQARVEQKSPLSLTSYFSPSGHVHSPPHVPVPGASSSTMLREGKMSALSRHGDSEASWCGGAGEMTATYNKATYGAIRAPTAAARLALEESASIA